MPSASNLSLPLPLPKHSKLDAQYCLSSGSSPAFPLSETSNSPFTSSMTSLLSVFLPSSGPHSRPSSPTGQFSEPPRRASFARGLLQRRVSSDSTASAGSRASSPPLSGSSEVGSDREEGAKGKGEKEGKKEKILTGREGYITHIIYTPEPILSPRSRSKPSKPSKKKQLSVDINSSLSPTAASFPSSSSCSSSTPSSPSASPELSPTSSSIVVSKLSIATASPATASFGGRKDTPALRQPKARKEIAWKERKAEAGRVEMKVGGWAELV